jgi:hypothetical protein
MLSATTQPLPSRAARRFAARNVERIRSRVLGLPVRAVHGAPKATPQQMVRLRARGFRGTFPAGRCTVIRQRDLCVLLAEQ